MKSWNRSNRSVIHLVSDNPESSSLIILLENESLRVNFSLLKRYTVLQNTFIETAKMLPILRQVSGTARVTRHFPVLSYLTQSKRLASQDYGSKQSGMEQGINQKNPKADLEHPGPESPSASKGGNQASNQSSGQRGSQSKSTSQGGSPAIHRPESAAEKDDPEVRKHNEELENRYERTANQLSEKDNKVDKNFWKGLSPRLVFLSEM
jgi:hypothetical protein